jgi:hypothetical protein
MCSKVLEIAITCAALSSGEPQIPGLTIIYLHPLGSPGDAVKWQNIIVHQTEGSS